MATLCGRRKTIEAETDGFKKRRPAIRPYSAFLAELGKTPSTGWRYAKLGWVELTNIGGKNYITLEAEEKFLRRACAGEFSKKAATPNRKV